MSHTVTDGQGNSSTYRDSNDNSKQKMDGRLVDDTMKSGGRCGLIAATFVIVLILVITAVVV